jgi:hypothetical protein
MKKFWLNFIYFISIMFSVISVHEAFADRGPSVEPFTEVDIETPQNQAPGARRPAGFNFQKTKERTPAGITAKDPNASSFSFIGPLIFLIALPFAIWMVITRKIKDDNVVDKTDYYPKNFQFKPYKTEYQKADEDDNDDFDVPKAS